VVDGVNGLMAAYVQFARRWRYLRTAQAIHQALVSGYRPALLLAAAFALLGALIAGIGVGERAPDERQ
jgi:hypothetical protein